MRNLLIFPAELSSVSVIKWKRQDSKKQKCRRVVHPQTIRGSGMYLCVRIARCFWVTADFTWLFNELFTALQLSQSKHSESFMQIPLTLQNRVAILRTTRFNIQNFYILPTVYLCVLCGSEKKRRLFPCTALTDWFLKPKQRVFTARYVMGL